MYPRTIKIGVRGTRQHTIAIMYILLLHELVHALSEIMSKDRKANNVSVLATAFLCSAFLAFLTAEK